MIKRSISILCKALTRSSPGATMIEVAIGITVVGLMVASIPPVMVLIVNQSHRVEEERIAENITRSQFEYTKAQEYKWGNDPALYDEPTGHWKRVTYKLVEPPSSYGIQVLADPIHPETGAELPPGMDMGVQKITVTIFGWRYYEEEAENLVLRTIDYKISRSLEIAGFKVEG